MKVVWMILALLVGVVAISCAVSGRKRAGLPTATEGETVNVKVFDAKGELVGPVEMAKVVKTEAEWKKELSPAVFRITRDQGTEPAFCGDLLDNHMEGVYTCVCCGLPLFSSQSKFESGTGWPSFFQPIAEGNVVGREDDRYGYVREEILCARCGCHLGHVFTDGPKPTGLRFCLNSAALKFTQEKELATLADPAAKSKN